MSIQFNAQWAPEGVPTNVATATIGIFDNTTQTTPVAPGTAMSNISTGNYLYSFASPIAGHTYTGTMTLITSIGAQVTFQQIVAVPATTPIPTSADDGSSSYIVGVYAQQRGLWTTIKLQALAAISTALAAGEGPSYSISGRAGSESLSLNEFLANMHQISAKATEMEFALTQELQNNQPFDERQRVGGCGRGNYGWW